MSVVKGAFFSLSHAVGSSFKIILGGHKLKQRSCWICVTIVYVQPMVTTTDRTCDTLEHCTDIVIYSLALWLLTRYIVLMYRLSGITNIISTESTWGKC